MAKKTLNSLQRRKFRVRNKLRRVANARPRLTVFRSGSNIYAQVVDDEQGKTLAAASTLDKSLEARGKLSCGNAAAVGKMVAERAKEAGVEAVYFDRGAYIYHGRVKALADAAREAGLKF